MKRLFALLLALVMVFSLAACNSNTKPAEDPTDAPTDAPTVTPTDAPEIDIWAPYEEAVTLSIPVYEVSASYPEGDDITNNQWIREYKDRFNIEIDFSFVAPTAGEYNTKIGMAVAENKLPDVFRVTPVVYQQLVEADMVMDLTEVFDTYASDLLKSYYELEPETFESAHVDGKLMAIPYLGYGTLASPKQVWIRDDWMAEQNLEAPETMEDLANIAKVFTENYDVASGLAVDKSLKQMFNSAYAWGAYPKTWIDDGNGNVVYGSVQSEMKAVLADWAQWVQEGIVSEDFATTDSSTYKSNASTGKYGLWIESNYYCGTAVDLCISADTLLTAYEIPTATGDPVLYPLSTANEYYHVVSKDCENPEAFIKLLNFYAYMINSGEVSAEDLEASNALQGIIDVAAMFRVIHPRADVNSFYAVDEAIKKESPEGLTGSELTNYNNYMDLVNNGNKNKTNLVIYGQQSSAYQTASAILEEGRTFKNKIWDVKPQTQLDMGSALDDILLEGFTKIILGHEPIEYFDTLVANWEAAGGTQMTAEANEIVKGN